MQELLNHCPPDFGSSNHQICTMKEYLDSVDDTCHLPIIVNVTSLKTYGRYIKHLIPKNTILLLIDSRQLDSILAEYHCPNDGRHHHHFNRHRLILPSGKISSKASSKFRSMKMLSKSLASLTTANQPSPPMAHDTNNNDNDDDDDIDDNTYHQRILVKNLNDKRSSTPLCRVPLEYQGFLEFLNENDQAIEPSHRLNDIIITQDDPNEPEKSIEKWPPAFFLRSSCPVFTKKPSSQSLHPTSNDRQSSSGVSSDSCYGSSSDLDSQKNPILLNDEPQILQSGQILTVLGDYYAVRKRIVDTEINSQPQSPASPTTWFKSKFLFTGKHRKSHSHDTRTTETHHHKSKPNQSEIYLKCQTKNNDTVYISVHESGLFSPLNYQINRSKSNNEYIRDDITGVFKFKDLLSNFRFPMSVRTLDGSISFTNPYAPAVITEHETPTKLRLLMPYTEHVVFACPLNVISSKSQKSSNPLVIIPLPVNADIEIQPCLNMDDISNTDLFHKLMENCYKLIEEYQTEISLIHFPLQIVKNNTTKRKQPLNKKRSHSECYIDSFEEQLRSQFRHSDDQLNDIYYHNKDSITPSSPLQYKDSIETLRQKLSLEKDRQQQKPIVRRSRNHVKFKTNEHTSEDEMYDDVDKIYDYIRSGDCTDDVQKIQAKEQIFDGSPSSSTKKTDRQLSAVCGSPGTMMTHRFPGKIDHDLDFQSCKNDGNVDDDQAHALYIASKQRSKPITKMKRINKH